MITSNQLPNQLPMLSFGFKACKLYSLDSDSHGNALWSISQLAQLVLCHAFPTIAGLCVV